MNKSDSSKIIEQLEIFLEKYLVEKAPSIPKSWKDFLVKITPYLVIIGVISGVPVVLALLGITSFVIPLGTFGGMMTGRPLLGVGYLIQALFLIVVLFLEALAIAPLFARKKKGWRYLYYAALINGLNSLIHFDLGGLIIGTGLSLYLLFQVKEYYN